MLLQDYHEYLNRVFLTSHLVLMQGQVGGRTLMRSPVLCAQL